MATLHTKQGGKRIRQTITVIRALIFAAGSALAAFCGTLTAGPVESTVQVAGFKYGVVMSGTGSGFVTAPETVVTAKHVAKMGSSLRVKDADGRYYNARVVRTGAPDWAILHVPGLRVKPLETIAYVPQSVSLTAYGRFREGIRFSHGASGSWAFQGAYGYATTKVYPGYSGGPVVDGAGRVVGIVSMQTPGGDCLYVPIDKVK